jgi:hypothetical protein
MKIFSSLLVLAICCSCASGKETVYRGSTPAHQSVRAFLGISLTDSIDFIRWELVLKHSKYELRCQYGIGKPGTPGFIDEKRAEFSGELEKKNNYYNLRHEDKTYSLLEINPDLLYLLDDNKNLLVGNGGFSYVLNADKPVRSDQFNFKSKQASRKPSMAFEGRTPCQELSALLGLEKSSACDKLKWYFIFYTDSLTGKPSYYLTGGTAYRKETMARGKWEIMTGKDGRIIYKLNPEKYAYSLYLLKADDNILFFTDAEGRLLVGNRNFSYALNKREREYPRREL